MTSARFGGRPGRPRAPVPACLAPPAAARTRAQPPAAASAAAAAASAPAAAAAACAENMTSAFKLDFLPDMMVEGRLLVADRM